MGHRLLPQRAVAALLLTDRAEGTAAKKIRALAVVALLLTDRADAVDAGYKSSTLRAPCSAAYRTQSMS
jgi:hypothetical protein